MNERLRVYYVDRLPASKNQWLYIPVKSIDEAKLVINTLTKRDLKDNRITDNIMGLEIVENEEWSEYYNDDGEDIREIMET